MKTVTKRGGAMLGFSIYLDKDIGNEARNYIRLMKKNGFSEVFSSVHIPEEDATQYIKRLRSLGTVCLEENLKLTVDIDEQALRTLGVTISSARDLVSEGISALRLDDGFTNEQIAELSHQLSLALNASTISATDVQQLIKFGADFKHMEAWHNYYPRPETGLDETWFLEKNTWLKQHNFKVVAFVSGDKKLRGPIFQGLPSLEKHRNEHPLVAAYELMKCFAVDKAFIGDPRLSNSVITQFKSFYYENSVKLHIETKFPQLFERVWHNRPEVARDVVRLVESRKQNQHLSVVPDEGKPRKRGTITIDNLSYGRYRGEIQICKVDLGKDKKVNVIGHVLQKDIALLSLIGENTEIEFISDEEKKDD